MNNYDRKLLAGLLSLDETRANETIRRYQLATNGVASNNRGRRPVTYTDERNADIWSMCSNATTKEELDCTFGMLAADIHGVDSPATRNRIRTQYSLLKKQKRKAGKK